MKIIINIIVILLFLDHNICVAQGASTILSFESQHLVTLSSGISLHYVRDEMMSPLIYKGNQTPIEFSYRYRSLSNRHSILFYYDSCELNSSITDEIRPSHYIKNLNLNFEYSYAAKINELEIFNTKFFLGARFSSMLNLRNHYFLKGSSHASAEQMTGVGIYILTETALQNNSKNLLSIEISIPFISYALLTNRYNANVSEKFNNLDFEKNVLWQLLYKGDLISFNKLFEIQSDISYKFILSSVFGVDLRYRFQYYSFEQYKSLLHSRVLNHQFLAGMLVIL